MMMKYDTTLMRVTGSFLVCRACLRGEGEFCHTPGCVLCWSSSPCVPWGDMLVAHGCTVVAEEGGPSQPPQLDDQSIL
jgi:hypothetical protein